MGAERESAFAKATADRWQADASGHSEARQDAAGSGGEARIEIVRTIETNKTNGTDTMPGTKSLGGDEGGKHRTSNIEHPTSNINRTSNIQHRTSNIQHRTSNIEHPTSNIQHRTSNIEHPTSNIQHRTSNIQHPTSNIQHPTSNIQHRTSNIQHRTSNIQHPTSNIEHRTSNIEHPTSNIQHRTSNIEHPMWKSGVSPPLCGTWHALQNASEYGRSANTQTSINIRAGVSIVSFIRRRNSTASRPSTSR